MENQNKKSSCPKVLVIGLVFIVAAILFAPILYDEYKYRRCIRLASDITNNSQLYKEVKSFIDYEAILRLQCYGAAFSDK
jgi:hypothetical protein